MSAGGFIRSVYQADDTTLLFPVRVQPETLTLEIDGTANSAGGAAPNQVVSAKVSGGRRELGVTCRKVRFQFLTAAPTGYKLGETISLPVLNPTTYAVIAKGQQGTYLGQAIQVVGKTPEYIN